MNKIPIVALVLEDECLIAIDIEDELADAGYAVFTAPSCEEAERWLQATRPDVVIVDIMLRDGPSSKIVARLIEANIPFIVH